MHIRTLAIAGLIAACMSGAAFAFGTVHSLVLNQDAEHERITRHALACGQGLAPDVCFQPDTMDELAGKHGFFGAVGQPDKPRRKDKRGKKLMDLSEAHCDNGDYFDAPSYPRSKAVAQENLTKCRKWMLEYLDEAVKDAAKLLGRDGKVDDSQIPTHRPCAFDSRKGRAKCDVLEDLGLMLHASQDFYSHSNWSDKAAAKAISIENPVGLNNLGKAKWLDLRSDQSFPDGLITGCYDGFPETFHCSGHVKHAYLNKDKGQIDPSIGSGKTDRGEIGDNFRQAVEAAVDDTKDKIYTFRERLVAKYGQVQGARMMCAIAHDDPYKTC